MNRYWFSYFLYICKSLHKQLVSVSAYIYKSFTHIHSCMLAVDVRPRARAAADAAVALPSAMDQKIMIENQFGCSAIYKTQQNALVARRIRSLRRCHIYLLYVNKVFFFHDFLLFMVDRKNGDDFLNIYYSKNCMPEVNTTISPQQQNYFTTISREKTTRRQILSLPFNLN